MIEVHNVTKNYGSVCAVDNVSFSVMPGDIVGLLGPNGAGKTTLMKILTGYHYPTSGTAVLEGHDVVEQALQARRLVGYLPENAPVYGEFTVTEYLNFVAEARGIAQADRKAAVQNALAECGLENMAHRTIDKLSKGYRQRTGLAQAIIHDPEILILDEPTSGLDPNQIIEIRNLITRLGQKKTVILSTHIMQEVEAVCSKVLIVHKGKIVAQGKLQDILGGSDTAFRLEVVAGELTQTDVLGIPGSVSAEVQEQERGRWAVRVNFGQQGATGDRIFDWAVARGYKLSAMNREQSSLEELFIQLTTGGNKE